LFVCLFVIKLSSQFSRTHTQAIPKN
jgi:hypothetical protein